MDSARRPSELMPGRDHGCCAEPLLWPSEEPPHAIESPHRRCVQQWDQGVLLQGEQWESILWKQNRTVSLCLEASRCARGLEVQVSVLHTTWFCAEVVQPGSKNGPRVH